VPVKRVAPVAVGPTRSAGTACVWSNAGVHCIEPPSVNARRSPGVCTSLDGSYLIVGSFLAVRSAATMPPDRFRGSAPHASRLPRDASGYQHGNPARTTRRCGSIRLGRGAVGGPCGFLLRSGPDGGVPARLGEKRHSDTRHRVILSACGGVISARSVPRRRPRPRRYARRRCRRAATGARRGGCHRRTRRYDVTARV
jgi:hypothetical protein